MCRHTLRKHKAKKYKNISEIFIYNGYGSHYSLSDNPKDRGRG